MLSIIDSIRELHSFVYLIVCVFCFSYRAVIILAIVITIAVLVTRNSDDDQIDESINTNPAKFMNSTDFLTLMVSFNGPIPGN